MILPSPNQFPCAKTFDLKPTVS